jgi:hypothetical protein
MNKWFLLLLVVGLAAVGWFNRERISDLFDHKPPVEEAPPVVVKPPATPNPASDSVALARQTYPALAKPGSAFNIRFVADYNQKKASDPDYLAQADWPMQLAAQTARELGGGALPPAGTTTHLPANHLSGTALNSASPHPGGSPTPPLLLPGLQGSSLDAPAHRSGPAH